MSEERNHARFNFVAFDQSQLKFFDDFFRMGNGSELNEIKINVVCLFFLSFD